MGCVDYNVQEMNRNQNRNAASKPARSYHIMTNLGFVHFLHTACALGTMLALASKPAGSLAHEPAGASVDFRQQIQPILSRNCYACHGPDEEARQGDLRLDVEAAAKQHAIAAGDPAASPLIARIFAEDPDETMPPPDTVYQLTPQEKQLIERWISEGADWQSHWAFEPIATEFPTVFAVGDLGDDRNAIDHYIAQQLEAEGIQPAPLADKATLLRRVYSDLIGLPPTLEQRDRFLADTSSDAFVKVVDQLLDSPAYGEQMAVAWLDAARFADTNGYQNDFHRSMWPWRDWVIQAFNRNLPYDQFIVDQIAGDLLPSPSQDQLIATGFNRNNRSVTEGGVIEEEWRIENCIDRVETTSAAFLGLTMGCARCHDHKYDPISQAEFYQFFAFFNNIDEKGVYFETRGNVPPLLTVPTTEQAAEVESLRQRIDSLQNNADTQPIEELLLQWDRDAQAGQSAPVPAAVFQFTQPASQVERGWAPIGASFILPGTMDSAGETPQPKFAFASDAPFTWSAWVQGESRGAIFSRMNEDDAYRGVDGLILSDGRLKAHLVDQWPQNAIAVISKPALQSGQWNAVTVTYDGQSKAAGVRVYFNGHLVELEVEHDTLNGSLASDVPFKIGQRSKSEFLRGELADFRIYAVELSSDQIIAAARRDLAARYRNLVQSDSDPQSLAVTKDYANRVKDIPRQQQIQSLQADLDRVTGQLQTTMIMRDRPEYRETYLLKRGQYDQPDQAQPLWPAIPAALPQLAEDQPPNRLGLAKWMIDPRNPLVARVAVNRAWLKFFGRGLVDTVDNFGVQGSPPTHPLLLDWLAHDFRSHGWDLKRLHKQIVLSATYRRSSIVTAEALAQDPSNRFFARGPRYRMSAEQVRDAALARAGLLVERVGGPAVFPYQPAGLWDELAGGAGGGPYVQSQGSDLYRRSLYTFRKRTVSHPVLATLDAPSWEVCLLKRPRTNTPLQALALLNDITYVEAARNLAQRMLLETPSVQHSGNESDEPTASADNNLGARAWISYGFDLVNLRQPTDSELETLVAGYRVYFDFYTLHPEQALAMAQVGDSVSNPQLDATQLASLTAVASILLNLDEALTKD